MIFTINGHKSLFLVTSFCLLRETHFNIKSPQGYFEPQTVAIFLLEDHSEIFLLEDHSGKPTIKQTLRISSRQLGFRSNKVLDSTSRHRRLCTLSARNNI